MIGALAAFGGGMMVLSLFVGMTLYAQMGWRDALAMWSFAAAGTAVIVTGAFLIVWGVGAW